MSDMSKAEQRADAKAEKARAKAMRPWFKKKRFILPLALIVIIVIAAIASAGGGDDETAIDAARDATNEAAATVEEATDDDKPLFPNRADRQREDQERNIGSSARLSGYTAAVTAAAFRQEISQFEKDGYLVADVTIENRDDRSQPYNVFDWKLQTPGRTVIDPTFSSQEDTLGSGDLVKGGKVAGKVI